jgi:hypothetical protein
MTKAKPCSTPVDTQAKLSANLGDPVADPITYQSCWSLAVPHFHPTGPHLPYSVDLSSCA